MAQQGSPPRRPARSARSSWSELPGQAARADRRSVRSSGPWQRDSFPADPDPDDLPPWAGPDIYAAQPGRRQLRPPRPETEPEFPPGGRRRRVGLGRGRAAAARLRKSRRKVLIRGALAVVAAVAIAVVLIITGQHAPAQPSDFVTSLQPGEFRAVPDACTAVGSGTLSQYLPGQPRRLRSISGSTESQCSFTVDAKPEFRVLEVTTQAFRPRVLAVGDGSATFNAVYSYQQQRDALAHPPRKSPLPKALITRLTGLGQQALSALQVSRPGGSTMDIATVLVRDRNVLITITLEGEASGGGYGPVSVAQLQAGALAAARQTLAGVTAAPRVG